MTTKLESEAPRVQVDLRAQFRNISNNSNDSNGNRGSLRISKRCSRRFSIQDDTETNFGISIDSVDSNEGSGLLSDGGGGDTTNFNYSDEYPYFGGPYAHIRKTLDHEYHTTYTKERQWLQDSIIDKLLNEIVVPNNNHKSNSQSISSSSSSSSSSCPPLPCDNGDNHTNNKNSNNNGLGKKRPSDTSLDKLSWMPEEPWLVYLVGTCHAPKSTALRLLLNEDDDDEDEDEDDYSNNGKSGDTKVDRPPRFPILSFVLVDPMEIQSLLPEYESYAAQSQSQSQSQHQNQNQNQNQTNKNTNIDNTEPDSVELISMRKETGYIAEILTRTALHLGTNVVVYTTFWNADWYPRYFELLRGEFCQRKLRIAILHLLAYDERTLYADAAYDALENDDDGGSVDGDHNCDGATSASTGTKTKRAITTTAAAPCMSSTSSTPLLSTIREGSSAALKILRSFSTSTIKTADSSTYGGSIGNSSSFISSSSSGGSSDSSACSMSQNSNKDMINNNITQNESSRIFTAVKALIPHVEYNCLLKATEQNNDVNIETKGITWKSFYTQFKQTSAVTGTVVLDNHGEERCCHLTKTNSVQHRGTNVLIQTFDVNQSTEENHKTDAMEFFGPYAHIRKTLDYKYHKNYRKDRQMLQDAIITDTLDAPRVIDSSGQGEYFKNAHAQKCCFLLVAEFLVYSFSSVCDFNFDHQQYALHPLSHF